MSDDSRDDDMGYWAYQEEINQRYFEETAECSEKQNENKQN